MEGTSRTRTRDLGTVQRTEDYTHNIYSGGTCTSSSIQTTHATRNDIYTVETGTETTKDVVTKNFKALSKKGIIINNPYSNVIERGVYPLFQVYGNSLYEKYGCTPERWYTTLTANFSGTRNFDALTGAEAMFHPAPDLEAGIQDLTDLAVTSAWAKIDSSEILGLVSLMESEKTLKGIYDSGRRLYKLMRNIKRLQLKEIAKALKVGDTKVLKTYKAKRAAKDIIDEFSLDALADRYMEARYGWRPLYYDFKGAVAAFYKQFSALRQTYRGKESYTTTSQDVLTYAHYVQPWQYGNYTFSRNMVYNVSVRAGVLCDVDLSKMDPWGLTKLVETLWDLTPYSFVIDWFLNVGDTLSAFMPDVGFTPRSSWVKVTQEVIRTTSLLDCTCVLGTPGANARISGSYSATMEGDALRYTKITTRVPSPARSILPTFKLRLSAAKILDLTIMIRNLLYGGNYPLKKAPSKV